MYSTTASAQAISFSLGWYNPLNQATTVKVAMDLRTLTGLSILPMQQWVKVLNIRVVYLLNVF